MSEPAKEKIYPAIPKSLWVTVDNEGGLSDIPKIRVKLEIDGVEEDIYNGYVVDGHVLHSRNLMGFIQRAIEAKEQEIIALESELKSARESAEELAAALDFYANSTNYSLDDYRGVSGEMLTRCILYSDLEERNEVSRIAGRRAREALKRFRGKV